MIIPLYFLSYRYLSNELSETNKAITYLQNLVKNTIRYSISDLHQKEYSTSLKVLKSHKTKLIKEINRRADRVSVLLLDKTELTIAS